MPVRRAECAWAPCELLTPRQYVYVKIANRCMVPWCTQGASTIKDLPRKDPLKNSSGSRFRASEAAKVIGLTHDCLSFVMMLIGRPLTRFFRPCVLYSPPLG